MGFILTCWVAFTILCAVIAASKGRSAFGWLILGAVFGIFALIAIACMPSIKPVPIAAPSRRSSGPIRISSPVELKKCPACAEIIKREATLCRFCGQKFDAVLLPSQQIPIALNDAHSSSAPRRSTVNLVLILIAAFLLIGSWATYSDKPKGTTQSTTTTTTTTPKSGTISVSTPSPSGPSESAVDAKKDITKIDPVSARAPTAAASERVGLQADTQIVDLTKVSRALPPKATQSTVSAPPLSEWTSSTDVSQIADTKNIHLRTTSKNQVTDKFDRSYVPRLWINCRENKTNLYVDFDGMFVADSSSFGRVTVRIDKEKAETWEFRESTDNRALGLWNGRGIPLIKKFTGKSRVLMRATPFNESSVEMEFSLTGFDAEIPALRKACSW